MGCKNSTTRQRSGSQKGQMHRPYSGHQTQPQGIRATHQPKLQLQPVSQLSSQHSSRKSSPTVAPTVQTVTGRLGRPYLYRHCSPLTTTSTSSSSYFNSTDSDEGEEYNDESAAMLMSPFGKGTGIRSRDSSNTSYGDTKTIHVMSGTHMKMNRSLNRRRAAKGNLNRSRRRANLHAQARLIADDFVLKPNNSQMDITANGDVSIPYGRAGGSFVLEDVHGGHGGDGIIYDEDGYEVGGGFFAGERKFLPYKYKNVHDPTHYCSSTAMVVVAGNNAYKGAGMGSVSFVGKSSSSPLGFRRQRRKHFKHNSSQGTLAGSPYGPGSAIVSSSSPLGFRRQHRRTHVKQSSSEVGTPAPIPTVASTVTFHNSDSTVAPNNNGSGTGSVGSGPLNRSGSVAYSSPNHEISSVGNMIMSRTLGPPETMNYYFGVSNNSRNTANGYNTNNNSQSNIANFNKHRLIMGGSSSVTVVGASQNNNNIFYQKCGGMHDDDEYFI